MNKLELVDIVKDYGDFHLKVDFSVKDGELVSILGPSGSGKTTILHIIAGFIREDKGMIVKDGVEISNFPPEKRNIGIVFQDYALFPFLDVFSNIAFGLRVKHIEEGKVRELVEDMAEKLEISHVLHKSPDKISGGEAQRAAIARALVVKPDILLMDEPMSSLDAKIREKLIQEVKSIKENYGLTIIYVTHDQREAMYLSDRIILFNSGKIEQIGTPYELYSNPDTPFAKTFIGKGNLLRIDGENIFVRPEDLVITREGEYSGRIDEIAFLGGTAEIIMETAFGKVTVQELYRNVEELKPGQVVYFNIRKKS
ncbi:MAG: ABC transporter ATP-binding protein [Caldisericaceae bacterium]